MKPGTGLEKLMMYLFAACAGMCFEYVYRVPSDVWYIPLIIGVLFFGIIIYDVYRHWYISTPVSIIENTPKPTQSTTPQLNRDEVIRKMTDKYIKYVKETFIPPVPKFEIGDVIHFNKFSNIGGKWYGTANGQFYLHKTPYNRIVSDVKIDYSELRDCVRNTLHNEYYYSGRNVITFSLSDGEDRLLSILQRVWDSKVISALNDVNHEYLIHIAYLVGKTQWLPEYMFVGSEGEDFKSFETLLSLEAKQNLLESKKNKVDQDIRDISYKIKELIISRRWN